MRTKYLWPMKRSLVTLCMIFISAARADASPSISADTSIVGIWKGTSICQVKPSACNDEIAICHISKGDKANTYHIIMNKLVNGVEEEVGTSDYSYNDGILTTYIEKYKVTITLKVKNDSMEGTLVYNNTLYRIIKLIKEK
jgi:hypothetical protein